jgi:hypothetical protein
LPVEPTLEEKQSVDTNQILKVGAVRRESAAFQADILPGDLILTTGAKGLHEDAPFFGLQNGVKKTLRLARNGRVVEVVVTPTSCS